jgi:hypothetical protein
MNTRRNKANDRMEIGGWLHLAATPTFAGMALATAITGEDPAGMLCRTMGLGPVSLESMSLMYLLMAIFHAAPWWQWVASRIRRRGEGHVPNPAAGKSRCR